MSHGIASDDLREMLQAAEAKLAGAQHLFDGGYYGDASSRAYYAVYHVLTAVLATKGASYASHAQVLGAFNKEFIHPGLIPQVPFQRIQRLFDDRQKGDYATMLAVREDAASADIETAQQVLQACSTYLKASGVLE